jgi:hypothetical protein
MRANAPADQTEDTAIHFEASEYHHRRIAGKSLKLLVTFNGLKDTVKKAFDGAIAMAREVSRRADEAAEKLSGATPRNIFDCARRNAA